MYIAKGTNDDEFWASALLAALPGSYPQHVGVYAKRALRQWVLKTTILTFVVITFLRQHDVTMQDLGAQRIEESDLKCGMKQWRPFVCWAVGGACVKLI